MRWQLAVNTPSSARSTRPRGSPPARTIWSRTWRRVEREVRPPRLALLNLNSRVARALLLHQREQNGGVRRMQPDAAARRRPAELHQAASVERRHSVLAGA